MRSNLVVLRRPVELGRRALPLARTSVELQRAVVAWADIRSMGNDISVLRLIEQPHLMSEQSVLMQYDGASFVTRYTGTAITSLHRSLAESLLREPLPATPTARIHCFEGRPEMRSMLLPFMDSAGFVVLLFESN